MRETLTGSRIREQRSMAGLKQVDMARKIGISASYLNLIEHNRRRIGGKLLLAIARQLGVDPQILTEGAEAALMAVLRESAQEAGLPDAETARAEEFAGRYPGWAEVLARNRRQIAALERTVEELTDRLAHNPHLAASMHEMLSTAAAIRSTAAILDENAALEPEWRARFHANIHQDSQRLSESAQSIVSLLEADRSRDNAVLSPQEEVEQFLSANGYHFPALEAGRASVDETIRQSRNLVTDAACFVAQGVLSQISRDAAILPLARLEKVLARGTADPSAVSRQLQVPIAVMLRRMAAISSLGAGLVVCDRSGTVIFRKSIAGFTVPRYGACCPLWPLFAALGQPGMAVHERISQNSQGAGGFDAYAVADVQDVQGYNRAPMVHSIMLLVPTTRDDTRNLGVSCRICPHEHCGARRELSILRTANPS